MFEPLHKKLASHSELLLGVWDVVVYGSAVRGKSKPRDIDIAVLMAGKIIASKKLYLAQQFRKNLGGDVKVVDLDDFLNPGFLARQAILAEGYSLLKKDYLAERFGYSALALITYTLKSLPLSKQKLLYYALQGRKRGTGVLAKLGGKIIGKSLLAVPTKHFEKLKDLLQQHQVEFETSFTLQY